MVLRSDFHSSHAFTQLDLLTLDISLEKIHSIWRIWFIKKMKVSKVQYHEGHGWWVHSWSSDWREQTLFTAFLCVCLGRVYGSQILLIFFRTQVPENTPQVSELSTQWSGRKQLPESQNWLLCGRDLVGGHRQVNSSFLAFYLKLNVGKVPTVHLLFEAFASREQ